MCETYTFEEFKEKYNTEEIETANDAFTAQKDQKYALVSMIAYMLGVDKNKFGPNQNFELDIYKRLDSNKNARIIRNLCMLRNALELRFTKILTQYSNGRSVLNVSEYIPVTAVMQLEDDGVKLTQKARTTPLKYIVEINGIIQDRINNCKMLFPDWIKWEYVKDVFIMPNGLSEAGAKAEGERYKENLLEYPYRVYLNWIMPHNDGNILLNDKKFVTNLYEWHEDGFFDWARVLDVSDKIKCDIYKFIGQGERVVMIVDCENSDVYHMISMLRGLEWEHLQKIAKIILVNDVHTNLGWKELETCTDIPIEHIMTQRIMEEKSLVDGRVIASAFKEFYEEKTDSFVLLSSDSDFWTLVDSLKDKAKFLVMVEHGKCGPDYKEILASNNIFMCYLDEFNSGEESEMMKDDILCRTINCELKRHAFNLKEILDEAMKALRINLDDVHRDQFYTKHLKNLQVRVDEKGNIAFECKRK